MYREIRKLDLAATAACMGSLLCWSIGPIFIKLLTGFVDCWTQNLLRYSVACVFWLPLLLFFAKTGRLDSSVWKKAALPAGINVVMQSFWAAAFYYINPAFMNLLVKSSVVWIVGLSLLFFADERTLIRSIRFWLGMSFCIVGVFGVLFFKRSFAATGTITGIIMTLAAAFLWGLYTVTARAGFRNIDSRVSFSVVTIYTVAGLALLAFVFGRPAQSLKIGTRAWLYVIVSGLTAIAFSHVFYYAAMKRIGAAIPSLVLLSSPFVVLSISRIIFGESLNIFQWAFGLLLLIGAALAILAQQHIKTDRPGLDN